MIDDELVKSLNEIAKNEGLTRARVTQVMNLLKLPAGKRRGEEGHILNIKYSILNLFYLRL